MSKQPTINANENSKKQGTYSAPSNWRNGVGYERKSRQRNVWTATAVLLAIVTFPTWAPMLIPKSASTNAVAFVEKTIKRQQFYVVDGDTIHFNGEKIRIANIDAPEIGQAKCDFELERGLEAKAALKELLYDREINIARGDPKSGRMKDRYGRTLALISVNGRDVGTMLIQRQLARQWVGQRMPWC